MQVDNILTSEFLSRYPHEAAKVMEKLPSRDVASLMENIEITLSLPIIEVMVPAKVVDCLLHLNADTAAILLSQLRASSAITVWRAMPLEKQREIFVLLNDSVKSRFKGAGDYTSLTVGDLMDPVLIQLPYRLSVSDALSLLRQSSSQVGCELFVVDDARRLVGAVAVDRLLNADSHQTMADIMTKNIRPVPVKSPLNSLGKQLAALEQRLPVVDKDYTLVGILDLHRINQITEQTRNNRASNDVLVTILTLYLFLIEQLFSFFSTAGRAKGGPNG